MSNNEEPKAYEENRQFVAAPHEPVYTHHVTPKTELDSTAISPEQYHTARSAVPQEYKPYSPPGYGVPPVTGASAQEYAAYQPPPSEVDGIEVSPRVASTAGSTLSPTERARSPSEWTDQTAQPDTDLSGFLIKDGAVAAGARSSSSQLERLKEERVRLQRLQDIAEQEKRLEEQIERELAEERK